MRILAFVSIVFFVFQMYFIIWGKDVLDQYWNPFLLFLSFIGLAICFFLSICRTDYVSFGFQMGSRKWKYISVALCALSFLFCLPDVRSLFSRYLIPDVVQYTDVLPLIIKQYEYFLQGKLPYQPIPLPHHTAYPAYLPLHWLPIGISDIFNKDPRWGGLILLVLSSFFFVFLSVQKYTNLFFTLLIILIPATILYIFVIWAGSDIAITYETVIAAYYFFLAIALLQRNAIMVVIGILLCLLSRYTLVFWLPLLFLLFYHNLGWRKTASYFSIIILGLCLLFIFPFLLRDTSIIVDSLAYHNNAAISDWAGNKYSFIWGVYFGPNIDFIVTGSAEHKVFVARMIQACTMLILLFAGYFFYKKNKHRANFYDIAMGMLYTTVICFYMIGPFAFRYYMLSPLYISLVLLTRILYAKPKDIRNSDSSTKPKFPSSNYDIIFPNTQLP